MRTGYNFIAVKYYLIFLLSNGWVFAHPFDIYIKRTSITMINKFKDLPVKDRLSYYVAFILIASGILLAFLSFFLNAYNIATGVLIYIAQCFVIGGGIVGANVYFKSKWIEFDTRVKQQIDEQIEKMADKFK